MIKRSKKVEEIIKGLALLQYYIKFNNKLSKYDVNKDCEYFFCDLFNIAYDLELSNMNRIQKNYPSIDLGSTNDKISVQITATTSKKKVDETIQGFEDKELYKEYKELWIFTLFEKHSMKSNTYKSNKYLIKRIDLYDFINEIMNLNKKKIEKIASYLDDNLENCMDSVNGSIEHSKGSIKKGSTYEQYLCYVFGEDSIKDIDKDYRKEYFKVIDEFSKKLIKLSKTTRKYLVTCMNYPIKEHLSHERLVMSWNEVSSNVKDINKLSSQISILIDNKFISPDDDSDYACIRIYEYDYDILYDLYCYCNEKDISVSDIIVELDFTKLD
ncbi:SMEK domain-containing protein [Inconstantimicrobium mannanitabidum]|uniref:Uncharacterized protein n=1 Tax=Inconstantimicrobium mannanitabidum TaxID=1604901 RepID=A0ACB5RDB1_9CLOT|nr:SMEK domain-containing protein [Clostridium sp. TW13]GKX66879.1 hypothetical protein rsdtw13_21370 [Clostridium sp. TW13]